jgi:hypothetical protein
VGGLERVGLLKEFAVQLSALVPGILNPWDLGENLIF